MPEVRKVVVDTSVLIAFEKLSLLSLLCSVYEQILLPPCVFGEYSSAMQPCFTVADAPQGLAKLIEHQSGLGCGESEAIALAYASEATILLDDRKAGKVAGLLVMQNERYHRRVVQNGAHGADPKRLCANVPIEKDRLSCFGISLGELETAAYSQDKWFSALKHP